MTSIVFIQPGGESQSVDAENGRSVMVAAVENEIDGIEAICNGSCSCGTCHILISQPDAELLHPPYPGELQVLSCLDNARPESRLACQLVVDDSLDGLEVLVP